MIIILFGQPGCGKTTLSTELHNYFIHNGILSKTIDGDEIRLLFKNVDYSREGRLNNLSIISNISYYLNNIYDLVIVSAMYPLLDAREYFNSLTDNILWVYLTYNEDRGKDNRFMKDFEIPNLEKNKILHINTSEYSIEESKNKIINFYQSPLT
jgi:adenylylsulfate kinase-like enzyme